MANTITGTSPDLPVFVIDVFPSSLPMLTLHRRLSSGHAPLESGWNHKEYGYINDLEGGYCFSRMTEVLS